MLGVREAAAVLYVSIKLATSPVLMAPEVIDGIAAALVLPSYTLELLTAVTVINSGFIVPVAAEGT